jgi:DNA-binding NarL/FixJ family response regulator
LDWRLILEFLVLARVFVVDDDESVRTSLATLLESEGYTVQIFVSADECLACRAHLDPEALFADRSNRLWIVLDPEGNFWTLPPVENPWDHRQPFQVKDYAELERVPGHYKYMLGLPF